MLRSWSSIIDLKAGKQLSGFQTGSSVAEVSPSDISDRASDWAPATAPPWLPASSAL